MRAEQGPLFKPKTPEYEYEIGSRHRKAENQALSKIIQKRQETAEIPHYDEAGQQVCRPQHVQQLHLVHTRCIFEKHHKLPHADINIIISGSVHHAYIAHAVLMGWPSTDQEHKCHYNVESTHAYHFLYLFPSPALLYSFPAIALQWEHARMKISEAEREAKQVEYKMREAADLARRSNEARSEAEQAMQLEQETRAAAKDLPGRTRAYLYDTRCKPAHGSLSLLHLRFCDAT